MRSKSLLYILIFCFCTFNSETEVMESTTTVESTTTTSLVQDMPSTNKNPSFELPYQHQFIELENCNNFMGSNLRVSCVQGSEIISTEVFDGSITNIEFYNDYLFVVLKDGRIIKYNQATKEKILLLDIKSNVLRDGLENGLLSFALNFDNSEFLISYVNRDNILTFELYVFENEINNIISTKKLLEIQATKNSHYGGKVLWSERFSCYFVSIGDMNEANFDSRIDSVAIDTSKYEGKIVGLNCDSLNLETPNYSKDGGKPLNNLIAGGLRNPWQFFEYKDYLVVFDTGFTQNEELNITKLENRVLNFGWPVFEGTKRAEDLDSIENYNLDIYSWIDGEQNNILDEIYFNSIKPAFYYNHHACFSPENLNCDTNSDVYRAAIIGGDIITDPNSIYNLDIFFADHLSQEIFSFDLINGDLKIFQIDDLLYVNILKVDKRNTNQLLVGTETGNLYTVRLP